MAIKETRLKRLELPPEVRERHAEHVTKNSDCWRAFGEWADVYYDMDDLEPGSLRGLDWTAQWNAWEAGWTAARLNA